MAKVLLTGGGSAGHVTPNLALIERLQAEHLEVVYVGSKDGIERQIIGQINIPYFSIATGKLRRYFSWSTFFEPFKILAGILQAYLICRRQRPNIVFSKGGFVAVPVVIGAWLNRIPIVIHEADLTPGLANRLCAPFADRVCVTFAEGKKYFANKKVIVTGIPIRHSLLSGDSDKGKKICGFNSKKPIVMITGGGLGAFVINNVIREIINDLLKKFQVVHICGKGKADSKFDKITGYKQFEYLNEEYPDIIACADLVISRAGANSLYELLVLKKPHLLIPLPLSASRGDQIHNAQYFAEKGFSEVLMQENLSSSNLLIKIDKVFNERHKLIKRMNTLQLPDSANKIFHVLRDNCK